MATNRKCCNTPRGQGPHAPGCPHGMATRQPSLREAMRGVSTEGRRELLHDAFGDLPDGAFWAMADELGLDPTDL